MSDDNDRFLDMAKRAVLAVLDDNLYQRSDLYIVWFSYTLGNFKALLSSNHKNGLYFEVTHNQSKNETYVDTYKKFDNQTVILGEINA